MIEDLTPQEFQQSIENEGNILSLLYLFDIKNINYILLLTIMYK